MDDPEKAQKIIFFSGLGADEKIFWLQANRFPQLETPRWAIPLPGEKMEEYIDRWIEELKLTPGQIVGGASFGGLIAQLGSYLLKNRSNSFTWTAPRSPEIN